MQRFIAAGDALDAHVAPRLRRALAHTDEPLARALHDRLSVIAAEQNLLEERLAAAHAFVTECEGELTRLRASG